MFLSNKEYLMGCVKILERFQNTIQEIDKKLRTRKIQVQDLESQDFETNELSQPKTKEVLPIELDSGIELKKQLDELYKLSQKAEYKLHNNQNDDLLTYLVGVIKDYSYNIEMLEDLNKRLDEHGAGFGRGAITNDNKEEKIDYQEDHKELITKNQLDILSNMADKFKVIVDTDQLINIDKIQDVKRKAHKETIQDKLEVLRKDMEEMFDDMDF